MSATQFYKFKGKSQFNQHQNHNRVPLTPEQKSDMISQASIFVSYKFKDGRSWSQWSKEFQHTGGKYKTMEYWFNSYKDYIDRNWIKVLDSAAFYDTNFNKNVDEFKHYSETDPRSNKILQLENGVWRAIYR